MRDTITRRCSIFCFRSLLNHDRRNKNVRFEFRDNVLMIYALRDIKVGEELVFDYCEGIDE